MPTSFLAKISTLQHRRQSRDQLSRISVKNMLNMGSDIKVTQYSTPKNIIHSKKDMDL
ncbi:MAG: hypothetical protein OXC40_00490 [Proteobacteria bacterium]|nr:hypothetical protein [Pseudomonadota bacterium]